MRLLKYLLAQCLVLAFITSCGGPAPTAAFTTTGTSKTPASITFTNASQNADKFLWDFGDGRSSTMTSPTMTFEKHGLFTVRLIAIQSSSSRSDTVSQQLTITPGKVFVTGLRIDKIPFNDPNGAGWDLATGPDIYFDFYHGESKVLSSETIEDVTPASLPISRKFRSDHLITDWADRCTISLYDYDATGDDRISSLEFSIDRLLGQGYPETFALTNSSRSTSMTLSVRWQ